MSSVFDIRPAAVDISSKLSSYSSFSKSNLSGSAIKMPYTPTSAMSMSAVQINDSGAATAENYPGEKSGSLETGVIEKGGEETVGERGVMDMSVLPSPPLTRVGTNESKSTRAGGSGAGCGRVVDAEKEKDITAWRESMQRADDEEDMGAEEEEEEDVGVEGEELEDPDEDGEFEGSEPRLREDGGSAAPGPGKVPLRPLKVDIIPDTQSPPIWEIDGPASTDDHHHQEEVDLTSQRHRIEELGSKALSPKRLIPKSSYYFGPPPIDSAFGTEPIGQIGVHHPREVVRIERDYSGGELVQFVHVYPLEFEGRISATRFLESINAVNEILISAHSLRHSTIDNALAFFTLQLSRLVVTTHYEKEMRRLEQLIDKLNAETFNPVGLNIVWPRKVAFMFLEIEYY